MQLKLQASWPDAPWLFLHADLWWGMLMVAVGLWYSLRFNPLRPGETLTGDADTE